jgi:hypothetical protein
MLYIKFLQEDDDNKKYHLVSWENFCQPKEQGGLGVVDLAVMNKVSFK